MHMQNPYHIQIQYYDLGKDIAFHITGGQAHIGAIATAYYRDNHLELELLELPHHKEGELAKECALESSKALKCTTTVLMGIHIDHATKSQIDEIVDYVRNTFKETLNKLLEE